MKKCKKDKPCRAAEEIHHKDPGKKGLQVCGTYNLRTKTRHRRIGYKETADGPMIWIPFCPWCGVDQRFVKRRKR